MTARDFRVVLQDLFGVLLLYSASEAFIWVLSLALAPAGLDSFCAIIGMVVLFGATTVFGCLSPACDSLVHYSIAPKVDIINSHLGVGFLTPIVMLGQHHGLSGLDVARVLGCFAMTYLVSLIAVFLLVLGTLAGTRSLRAWFAHVVIHARRPSGRVLIKRARPSSEISRVVRFDPTERSWFRETRASSDSEAQSRIPGPGDDAGPTRTGSGKASIRRVIVAAWPSVLSFFGLFAVGLPLSLHFKDERPLDAFALCFLWTTALRLQRSFKESSLLRSSIRLKYSVIALLHPILWTTLLMIAYLRLKATAERKSLQHILTAFGRGTPLYSIWTSKLTGVPIRANPKAWFGVGDAALSLVECGILVWAFKLYQCRGQIFSLAGAVASVCCIIAAAASVFLSVLAGHAVGLRESEAISFAVRSTTLALAKPAVEAVGGNVAIVSVLIVSNGIVGQLLFPWLGMHDAFGSHGTCETMGHHEHTRCEEGGRGEMVHEVESAVEKAAERRTERMVRSAGDGATLAGDSPVTVAAGVAVGTNGAAMGVSYLYEARGQAAPFAVLSMTVFGVMTVVFTTVYPFRDYVEWLARGDFGR